MSKKRMSGCINTSKTTTLRPSNWKHSYYLDMSQVEETKENIWIRLQNRPIDLLHQLIRRDSLSRSRLLRIIKRNKRLFRKNLDRLSSLLQMKSRVWKSIMITSKNSTELLTRSKKAKTAMQILTTLTWTKVAQRKVLTEEKANRFTRTHSRKIRYWVIKLNMATRASLELVITPKCQRLVKKLKTITTMMMKRKIRMRNSSRSCDPRLFWINPPNKIAKMIPHSTKKMTRAPTSKTEKRSTNKKNTRSTYKTKLIKRHRCSKTWTSLISFLSTKKRRF